MSDSYRQGESIRENALCIKLEKIFQIANIGLLSGDDERCADVLSDIWEIIDGQSFDLNRARAIRDGQYET